MIVFSFAGIYTWNKHSYAFDKEKKQSHDREKKTHSRLFSSCNEFMFCIFVFNKFQFLMAYDYITAVDSLPSMFFFRFNQYWAFVNAEATNSMTRMFRLSISLSLFFCFPFCHFGHLNMYAFFFAVVLFHFIESKHLPKRISQVTFPFMFDICSVCENSCFSIFVKIAFHSSRHRSSHSIDISR